MLTRRKIRELQVAMRDDREASEEWQEPLPGRSIVYFIQIADQPDSPIKIGFTSEARLETRLSGLQVGCPYRLRILATMLGGEREEGRLHRTFAHIRVQGEWFKPSLALVAYIDGLPNCVRNEPPIDIGKAIL